MSTRDALALYGSLDQEGLLKVARAGKTDLEDVCQQALMICVEIAAGVSTVDPLVGSLDQFVFGRLWGFASREARFRSDNRGDDDEPDTGRYVARDEGADPLKILISREEDREEEQRRAAVVAAIRRVDPHVALEVCLATGGAGNQSSRKMGRHRATGWRKRCAALDVAARLLGFTL
ncbi:MAG: hypothetical protein M0T84_15520 [Betaproteobacteria bacterium]|nr:hypothetical protein [Betaproteobacteria bacterium]